MFARRGMNIGDLWPYCDEAGTVHLYCLTAPAGDPAPNWEISHLTGTDLINWEFHGGKLPVETAGNPAVEAVADHSEQGGCRKVIPSPAWLVSIDKTRIVSLNSNEKEFSK